MEVKKHDLFLVWHYCFDNKIKKELVHECQYASNRSIINNMSKHTFGAPETVNERISKAIEVLFGDDRWGKLVLEAEIKQQADQKLNSMIKNNNEGSNSNKLSKKNKTNEQDLVDFVNYFIDAVADRVIEKLDNKNKKNS